MFVDNYSLNYGQNACKILNKPKGDFKIMQFLVVVALAVVIFIGVRNKKKIAAEQKAAEEKAAAEQKAVEEKAAAEQKVAEEKAAACFKSEFEKMWANLEKNPYSINDEKQKLKEKLGLKDTTDEYGIEKANKLFETCFTSEVKEKIYSRSSSASFIIGNVLKSNFEGIMQRAYGNGTLHGHLIGFVLCANRYEKFTGDYADYPNLSDEEISNFIIKETSFSDDRASTLTVSAREAIKDRFVYWLNGYDFGYLLTNSDEDDNYDEFIFDFICSAIFSAYFNDSQYEKGNSKSMIDCIYNNIPITTQYWFCKNVEYLRIDLMHMMPNHDAAFRAMLDHYGLTRADQVAKDNVPRQGKCLAGTFDGRNC